MERPTPHIRRDAKYKRITSTDFPNTDIYQMLAYCTAADLPSGLLIYAAEEHERGGYHVRHCITNAGKTIEVAAIDLSGQPEDILRQVKGLACRVERHAGRRHSARRKHPEAAVNRSESKGSRFDKLGTSEPINFCRHSSGN